ncbi:MAG: indolepyruvate ferredoxin oxidoreductase subunit alpha [Deltaproteobacteria bacterium]|nr:indolepyruvate ferredoxin oxidoreductase subunit alpha [Deltaproteobacteria bacterium]
MKKLMLGNEAIAAGAWQAGVEVAVGYPGTPSTEILERLSGYDGVYTEWSVNEKVAMDVAIGASLGGVRTLVTMKAPGLNVAADAFFPICQMGVNGGLVLVCSDDVGALSSPTEQDTRVYAKLCHVPMLEPSDSEEASAFTALAYELSERFDTPVFLRTTNGVSHSMGLLEIGARQTAKKPPFEKTSPKFRPQGGLHPTVFHENAHRRLESVEAFAETASVNRIEWGDRRIGFVAAGSPYSYLKEVCPEASFLKLGMTYPVPGQLLREFAAGVEALYVIEDLEPFLEEELAAKGVRARGRELRRLAGPLSVESLRESLADVLDLFGERRPAPRAPLPDVPPRFPTLCAGCPHLALYYAIRRAGKGQDVVIMGDIGCYSLGIAPPHNMLSCAFAMGTSVGSAHGLARAAGGTPGRPIVAYLGDSTFLHAGMPAVLNAVHNGSNITVVIADNRITAMTGGQENALTGKTLSGDSRPPVRLPEIVKALGVRDLYEVDPFDNRATVDALKSAFAFDGVSVVIGSQACRVYPERLQGPAYRVHSDRCTGCGNCLDIHCPAIVSSGERTEKGRVKPAIDAFLCGGCSFCAGICPADAIGLED